MRNDLRESSCCFTGHRPEKLSMPIEILRLRIERAIDTAIAEGYTTFITGMARGTDIWAAEIVLEKKRNNKAVCLVCAVPHPGFEKRWKMYERYRYHNILRNADEVVTVNDRYFAGCYQVRNKYMVDRSSLVIAVFGGRPSGTKNTVDYAKHTGVRVVNVLKDV